MAKNILILTHEFPPCHGGIATYAKEVATSAQLSGHKVTVVAPDHGQQQKDTDDELFKVIRYRGGIYNFSYKSLLQVILRTLFWVNKEKYDIIHAVDHAHIESLNIIHRFRKTPFIATLHGTEILGFSLSRKLKALGIQSPFDAPTRILTNSHFTKSLLIEKFPSVDQAKIQVTHLAANDYWFEQVFNSKEIRDKYGIPQEDKLILTVARIDERKGQHLVLEALKNLPPALKKEVSYVIVGPKTESSYLAKLHQLAASCEVNVIFTGAISQDDLRTLYKSAYLFCMPGAPHPHKVEGFGLVYLEAAAQGLPSIASHLSAIPEVVLDGKTGILVPPLDVKGIQEAIEIFLQDPAQRHHFGQQARIWAKSFSWSRCAAESYN